MGRYAILGRLLQLLLSVLTLSPAICFGEGYTLVKYTPPAGKSPQDYQKDFELELKLQKLEQNKRFVQMCIQKHALIDAAATDYVLALNNLESAATSLREETELLGVLYNKALGINYDPNKYSHDDYLEIGRRFLLQGGNLYFGTPYLGHYCAQVPCEISAADFADLIDELVPQNQLGNFVLNNFHDSFSKWIVKNKNFAKAEAKEKQAYSVLAKLVKEYLDLQCAFGISFADYLKIQIQNAQQNLAPKPIPPPQP